MMSNLFRPQLPMNRLAAIALLSLLALTAGAQAASTPPMPARGASMQQVEQAFGPPLRRHAPAGGDSPRHPAITRWDYPGFAVYFEQQRVIDTVVPGDPPHILHRNQLQSPAAP